MEEHLPRRLLPCVLLVAAMAIPLAAQQGSVRGSVVGVDGKPVTNATVVLRELSSGGMKELSVDNSGEFRFTEVPPGSYLVEACGPDFTAGTLLNVGPVPYEANPNQTVSLSALPNTADDGSGLPVIFLAVFTIALGAFWSAYSVRLFFLRVPIITWTLLSFVCILLYSMQHALLALNQADAVWVGVYIVFVMIAVWQGASTVAAGAALRFGTEPSLPSHLREWLRRRLGEARYEDLSGYAGSLRMAVLYFFPILGWLFLLSINSLQSGTSEWNAFVSKGAFVGCCVWLAASLLVVWIVQFASTRSLRPWTRLFGWLQVSVTALIGFVGYWFLYRARSSGLATGSALTLGSPIIHVLFLLGELCLLLTALTYWLDKYRIPLLTILVVFIGIGIAFHRGDYTFESAVQAGARPSPSDAITGRRRIIAVAAAGGGVQAAAWTARVLGGLSQADPRFQPAVRLLSEVSGGSVGVMYFTNTYPDTQGGMNWSGDKAFQSAGKPLLDAVTWGLVNVDLRYILSGTRTNDRGAILSRTLGTRADLDRVHLSEWSGKIAAGLPAVLLNATEVETGRPIVFSSTSLNGYGIIDFPGFYQRDPEIPTAVRLSASFPFVTPVARLQGQDAHGRPFPHLADGGYYDNYGMYSLMAWLQEALAGITSPPEVLVLRIEAFPANNMESTTAQGWPFQTWAPLTAMMSVRSAAQLQRNDTDFRLFQQQYKPGMIKEVTFRYQPPCGCPDPPLSWDLSPVEIECLDLAWRSQSVQNEAALVEQFMNAR
jgi:Carboxypeptidase regulatory-like domain/Patatin-like phospholipase